MKDNLKKIETGRNEKKRMLAVLLDPDKCSEGFFTEQLLPSINRSKPDFIFIGGSLLTNGNLQTTIELVRSHTEIPLILFPGDSRQIDPSADGILLLSLISGRNPDLLIGQHVQAAVALRQSGLEILPTGYILVGSEKMTTAIYISQTLPVPAHKPEIAACTALAGEQLGLKLIYLDGGSGASGPIPEEMVASVCQATTIPVIAGGGITAYDQAVRLWNAGATLVVVGTAIEKNPEILDEFSKR